MRQARWCKERRGAGGEMGRLSKNTSRNPQPVLHSTLRQLPVFSAPDAHMYREMLNPPQPSTQSAEGEHPEGELFGVFRW